MSERIGSTSVGTGTAEIPVVRPAAPQAEPDAVPPVGQERAAPAAEREQDAAQVPIDHVVPLAAAWVQGAAGWAPEQREAFANDLTNLIATTRSENSAKGDSTAEEWVPSDPAYGCSYATVVVTVKSTYALSVTPAESQALQSLLATC